MKEQAIEALESIRDDLRAVGSEEPPELERVPPQTVRGRQLRRALIDAATFAVLGGIAAGAVVAFSPQYTTLAVDAYLLYLGALALWTVTKVTRDWRARPGPPRSRSPSAHGAAAGASRPSAGSSPSSPVSSGS